MSDFNELSRAPETGMHFPDAAALRTLSLGQRQTFTRYVRKVLPLDGFVFWVAEDTKEFEGALFHDTILLQNEDETVAQSTITFTSIQPVQPFEEQSPNELWIGEYHGRKFAFSRLSQFFEEASIWYYSGLALQAAFATQLIDSPQGISDKDLIVSNSLPAWLQLINYDPIWMQTANPGIVLYPSFAVPQNLRPPYGSVHIEPRLTRSLQGAPLLTLNNTHYLLASDTVTVTLYGCDNDTAANFVDLVNQFSIDTDAIGLMNMPVIVDEKRTQTEMGVLAMKKTILYEVSYQQLSIRNIARQMIDHVKMQLSSVKPKTNIIESTMTVVAI